MNDEQKRRIELVCLRSGLRMKKMLMGFFFDACMCVAGALSLYFLLTGRIGWVAPMAAIAIMSQFLEWQTVKSFRVKIDRLQWARSHR